MHISTTYKLQFSALDAVVLEIGIHMVARVTNIWLLWLKLMLATVSLTSLCKQKTNSVDGIY